MPGAPCYWITPFLWMCLQIGYNFSDGLALVLPLVKGEQLFLSAVQHKMPVATQAIFMHLMKRYWYFYMADRIS